MQSTFDTSLPGRLSDVFGLKTNAFYDIPSTLKFQLDGDSIQTAVHHYEVLEPSTATVVARFTNTGDHAPALTINDFSKGKAIYLATESNPSTIGPRMNYLYTVTGIRPGPKTPEGVYARVVDGRTLYVNTTQEEKKLEVGINAHGVLSHKSYMGEMKLGPYQAELVK